MLQETGSCISDPFGSWTLYYSRSLVMVMSFLDISPFQASCLIYQYLNTLYGRRWEGGRKKEARRNEDKNREEEKRKRYGTMSMVPNTEVIKSVLKRDGFNIIRKAEEKWEKEVKEKGSILKKYHVFAPMGRFQLESIYDGGK